MDHGWTGKGDHVQCLMPNYAINNPSRAELQRAFFPPTYQNVEVTPQLEPGDQRLWPALQIFVELRDDTSLYVPFREASKVRLSHILVSRLRP